MELTWSFTLCCDKIHVTCAILTICKCSAQWYSVPPHCCVTTTPSISQTLFIWQNWNSVPIEPELLIPPAAAGPSSLPSASMDLTAPGEESHSICRFVTGLSHVPQCPQGSSVLQRVPVRIPLFWRNNPLDAYIAFCLSVHLRMDTWVASTFLLLWTRGTNVPSRLWCQCFCFAPTGGIAGANGSSVFNFLRNHHTAFHSRCSILSSQLQGTKVSVSPHPHQHLLFLFCNLLSLFIIF